MEEFNKKFKKYLHALFHNFEDWVTVYSNTPALDEMDRARQGDYGTQRENREVFGPVKSGNRPKRNKGKPDFVIIHPADQSSMLNLEQTRSVFKVEHILTVTNVI